MIQKLLTGIAVATLVIVMSGFAFFPAETNRLAEKILNQPGITEPQKENSCIVVYSIKPGINNEPAELISGSLRMY
jgi:hypothetical protein